MSGFATGSSMTADSRPRTQCGTFTGGVRTFSSPAFFISAADHSIARSSEADPLRRLPILSQRYCNRSSPSLSASAAAISFCAVSRYGSVIGRLSGNEGARNEKKRKRVCHGTNLVGLEAVVWMAAGLLRHHLVQQRQNSQRATCDQKNLDSERGLLA